VGGENVEDEEKPKELCGASQGNKEKSLLKC